MLFARLASNRAHLEGEEDKHAVHGSCPPQNQASIGSHTADQVRREGGHKLVLAKFIRAAGLFEKPP